MVVGDNPSENHLFTRWYECMCANQPIFCIDGQIFAPTFVDDVAEGILRALDKGICGLYNLCNNEFFNRGDLAKQFVIALHGTTGIVKMPSTAFNFQEERPLMTYLDGSKFRKAVKMEFTSMREVFQKFMRFI
jgi:dTDP-4-dehydrorhamnose reductase